MGMAAVMATTFLLRSASFVRVSGEDFGVGFLAGDLGLAGFRIVGAQAVKLLLAVDGGLEAAAFLRDGMKDDGLILLFEELECVN